MREKIPMCTLHGRQTLKLKKKIGIKKAKQKRVFNSLSSNKIHPIPYRYSKSKELLVGVSKYLPK